ncbi:MAG TPA: transposase [Candidatus Polarisedimenticolaceae bacterium]|nr:transposase [Candidatus Polarisedimenticolaceae bacterium]
MARPLRQHVPGAICHVTQRGNDRRPIFLDDQDRTRYLAILGRALERQGERVHAYCLLTNHVHLLLQASDRPLSALMHVVGLRYARWFNDRWAHTGHLFQGRYYSAAVQGDPQLLIVLRYIHLNPVRAGLAPDVAEHRWSSHRAYAGGESPPPWLTTGYLLALLGRTQAAARDAYAQLLSDAFALEDLRPALATAPARQARVRVPFECILGAVAEKAGCSPTAILGRARDRRTSLARFAVVHLAREAGEYRLADLARLLGRDPATLYNGVARRVESPTAEWKELVEGVRLFLSSERK